jgi:tetratricopeptide (TPR) repeat protein
LLRAPEAGLLTNPGNYERYLKARFFSFKFDQASFTKALELFEKAIESDPVFAPAHAALALMLTAAMMFGGPPPSAFYGRIEQHATVALSSSGESAEAQAAIGFIRAAQADWAMAESAFLQALDINPSLIGALEGYSQMLSALGANQRAVVIARRARELDPLSQVTHMVLGSAFYYAGRLSESVEVLQRSIQIEPGFGPASVTLAFIHETKGELEEAVRLSRTAAQSAGDTPLMKCVLARSLALAGEMAEANQILEELVHQRGEFCVSASWIALIYAALERREEAWAWLERAFIEKDPWRIFLNADPRFRYFSGDARFGQMLKELGLSQNSTS